MPSADYLIECPRPGPYPLLVVEPRVHGYPFYREDREVEADPLLWKVRIHLDCEIAGHYGGPARVGEPIRLELLSEPLATPMPEPAGGGVLVGALLLTLLAWRRR